MSSQSLFRECSAWPKVLYASAKPRTHEAVTCPSTLSLVLGSSLGELPSLLLQAPVEAHLGQMSRPLELGGAICRRLRSSQAHHCLSIGSMERTQKWQQAGKRAAATTLSRMISSRAYKEIGSSSTKWLLSHDDVLGHGDDAWCLIACVQRLAMPDDVNGKNWMMGEWHCKSRCDGSAF